MSAFNFIPKRRRKRRTPNAERPISNEEKNAESIPVFWSSTFGVGCWAFGVFFSPAFLLAPLDARRLLCRTLCDHSFAEPDLFSQPVR
jgi:hypothetical protein